MKDSIRSHIQTVPDRFIAVEKKKKIKICKKKRDAKSEEIYDVEAFRVSGRRS
jgi:hypothetical protein